MKKYQISVLLLGTCLFFGGSLWLISIFRKVNLVRESANKYWDLTLCAYRCGKEDSFHIYAKETNRLVDSLISMTGGKAELVEPDTAKFSIRSLIKCNCQ